MAQLPLASLSSFPFLERLVLSLCLGALLLGAVSVRAQEETAPESGPVPDHRFGIVNSGSTDPETVAQTLELLGATSWYTFGSAPISGSGQVGLVRPGADLASIQRQAEGWPGTSWLIGNEPNLPGQDDVEPSRFADFVFQVSSAIRTVDPNAVLVGPNVLNWETTCRACPGFTSGREWAKSFVGSYEERYGPLPFDAWGMHLYNLNWERLPLIDAAADLEEIQRVRTWLDERGVDLPIWISEFGVVWSYDEIEWRQQPDGTWVADPGGSYRWDLLTDYLDRELAWLVGPGTCARVERWFLYATDPPPEPYASAAAGIVLVDREARALTGLGENFHSWASGQRGDPSPTCE